VQDIDEVGRHLHNHVIICGYGRSGQYLGRFLQEEQIPFVALDIDPSRVLEAASAGENVMFGDAARRVVLEAAGGARAKALVISYADNRAAMKILHIVQENYPQLPVIVRTVDDSNMEALREAGATEVVPEILEGSLMLASHALMLLGVPLHRVVKRIRLFREARYQLFKGYFHGISDAEDESLEKQQVRLHSVIISPGSFAIGRRLVDMQLESFNVEVKSIRRPNSNGMVPTNESPLAEGDVVVLLGQPTGLTNAQNALLIGRVAAK
jgi:CPA2 family monovalent cation:H+ antiporter-2